MCERCDAVQGSLMGQANKASDWRTAGHDLQPMEIGEPEKYNRKKLADVLPDFGKVQKDTRELYQIILVYPGAQIKRASLITSNGTAVPATFTDEAGVREAALDALKADPDAVEAFAVRVAAAYRKQMTFTTTL